MNKPIVRHLRRPAVQFARTLQLSVIRPSQVVEQGLINPLNGVQATGEPFIQGVCSPRVVRTRCMGKESNSQRTVSHGHTDYNIRRPAVVHGGRPIHPTAAPAQITHLSEDQLGFFGLTPDGSLVLDIPEDAVAPGTSVVVPVGYPDYRFPAEYAPLGPRKQVRANMEAVRTLRQVQAEGRAATGEEQDVLARYIGWGPFPGVFVDQHPEWGALGAELGGLLTPGEWRATEASTPNANHTPGIVVRAVYGMLARLGIDGPVWEGLNALEPGMGTGAFLGHGPAPESGVRWTGVEMEPVAGEIARLLFPTADIRVSGFEQAALPANAFDLVVGNVPFGNYPVHDPVWNPRLFSIHNYFIWKSIGLTRPGGIVALITSRYTLDQHDNGVRQQLAERADLLAAVRLPDSAFRGRAVQRVTTDLLILRRRDSREEASGPAWLDTVEVETPDGPARVNEYFAAHPEMMAGSLRLAGKNQYRTADPAVVLPPRSSLDAELERITALLPEDVYAPRDAGQTFDFRDAALAAGLADGAYKVIRGRLRRWLGGRWIFHGLKNERDIYRVVSLCAIRDAQRDVLRTQAQDCPEEEQAVARAELNRLYDAFVKLWDPAAPEAGPRRVQGGTWHAAFEHVVRHRSAAAAAELEHLTLALRRGGGCTRPRDGRCASCPTGPRV